LNYLHQGGYVIPDVYLSVGLLGKILLLLRIGIRHVDPRYDFQIFTRDSCTSRYCWARII